MNVVLRKLASGRKCHIYAYGEEESCPLYEFLQKIKQDDVILLSKLKALLDRVAEHGTPQNKEKCRFLRGQKLFELKTGQARIMGFWDKGHIIICSHGF